MNPSNEVKMNPSNEAQEIIVRVTPFDVLSKFRDGGIMLGKTVIVTPNRVGGEITRRTKNAKENMYLTLHYQGFI